MNYIVWELSIAVILIGFVFGMCGLAKRWLWPKKPVHPSFVGSLIGASGTIFAASVAWSAANYTVDNQRQQARQSEIKAKLAAEQRETENLQELWNNTNRLMYVFPTTASAAEMAMTLTGIAVPTVQQGLFSYPTENVNELAIHLRLLEGTQQRYWQTYRTEKEASLEIEGRIPAILNGIRAIMPRITKQIEVRRRAYEEEAKAIANN
jgi:hypothetical protein